MLRYRITRDTEGNDVFTVDSAGAELLHNPILNKGSAFTHEERRLFGIDGLLPPAVSTLEMQVDRRFESFNEKTTDLEKYIFLRALQDRNEILFYALLSGHLAEMIPIVYTPTVGLACQKFSHIFRFTRGVFFSPENIDEADAIFKSLPYRNIEMIVVTDSEGILGIGDQGIGGMGIPVGKLSLYVGTAGIHPANTLPVALDVGTNNEELLADPLYLGIRQERLRGDKYFDFVEKFVSAVKRNFPGAVLQWEDFSKQNAFTLLERYRNELPSFNDDIQGTGAVVLAGIQGALKISGERLFDQVFAILGAGAGGVGVSRQIYTALLGHGLSPKEAQARIFVLDSKGVIFDGREGIEEYKREFSQTAGFASDWKLENVRRVTLSELVKNAGVSVLVGVSGVGGAFPEDVIKAMARNTEKPVIFPLSNPTDKTEAIPVDIYKWTDGKAIVAAGSPFPDVNHKGRVFVVGQGNNVYIFPGVGLGSLVAGAKMVSDEMITAAAKKLSELVSTERLELSCVYPPISDLRSLSREIAIAVAQTAVEQGLAEKPLDPGRLGEIVDSKMWTPKYAKFRRS